MRSMHVRWYGQSTFALHGGQSVFIDPFGEMGRLAERGIRWEYPPIEGAEAELLLVTHEHGDHNAVEVVGGSPQTIRSTAGTIESPLGEVTAIASEHDDAAGTKRGPNTIFVFALDGLRVAHFGDFGQAALRPEQHAAIGEVDVLFLPVGGGPTVGGAGAAAIVHALRPRLVVPMHYRTEAIGFLDPPDEFIAAVGGGHERLESSELDVEEHLGTRDEPRIVELTPPSA
jgi:L-ascorbate metabolism protein UlaG (beta-lactamase superfamily)